jgi:tetratricopeptide (TPR) repeat protein
MPADSATDAASPVPGAAPTTGRTRFALAAGLLVAMTLVAYIPAMRGGYVWDDDAYVQYNPVLRDAEGLRKVWLEPQSVPQYYPLVYTTYWIERRLWNGLGVPRAPGHHLTNVLLHAISAVLLWRLLRRLALPGAYFAAAVWALHPVCVESVAWITERKNVLSGVFCFLSMLTYLRFCGAGAQGAARRRWGLYAASFGLFVGALLGKTVTASMPAVILVVLWWKRDRLRWADVWPLLPMLAVGAAMGLVTAHLESEHVGAKGTEWAFSVVDRFLIAGRALWFYAGKVVWPARLAFFYPRWRLDAGSWWQYLPPLGVVAAFAALWLARRPPGASHAGRGIGRGPLAAVLIFAGTLFPALGFLNVYPMRFSFVADHFQYLACASLIALAVAAVTAAIQRSALSRRPTATLICAGLLLLALGALTWRQGRAYHSAEALWRDTLRKHPDCAVAHNNLGRILYTRWRSSRRTQDLAEAKRHLTEAARLRSDNGEAHNNLGLVLMACGDYAEAAEHLEKAIQLRPYHPSGYVNMEQLCLQMQRWDEAERWFREALARPPEHPVVRYSLAELLERRGDLEGALAQLREAVKVAPGHFASQVKLGLLLAEAGKPAAAEPHLRKAVRLRPDHAQARYALAGILAEGGSPREAVAHYRVALERDRTDVEAMRELAWLLATCGDAEVRSPAEAIGYAELLCQASGYGDHRYLDTLAAAYAAAGDFARAVETARKAVAAAEQAGTGAAGDAYRRRMALYKAGRPYVAGPKMDD